MKIAVLAVAPLLALTPAKAAPLEYGVLVSTPLVSVTETGFEENCKAGRPSTTLNGFDARVVPLEPSDWNRHLAISWHAAVGVEPGATVRVYDTACAVVATAGSFSYGTIAVLAPIGARWLVFVPRNAYLVNFGVSVA